MEQLANPSYAQPQPTMQGAYAPMVQQQAIYPAMNTTQLAAVQAANQVVQAQVNGQQPGYLQPPQQVYALTQEDLVIRVFFQDAAVGPKLRDTLRPELFRDPINRTIVEIVRMFEKKHDRIPTAQELITGMGANEYALQARDKLIFIYNTPIQTMHQDYVVLMVESFFKERLSEEVLVSAAESIHDKRVDGIRDLIPRLQASVNFSLHTDLGLNMYSDAELALAKLREQKQCIPSGINEIRYYTGRPDQNGMMAGGGYYRKTLTLFVGQPNIGKSLTLCSEAAFAYKSGFNVLYITLELAEDYVWQRLAANICGVDMYDVVNLTGDVIRERIDAAAAATGTVGAKPGQLHVRYMKTTTTPVEIEAVIDSFELAHGKLDLLVVDYIGIMKPASRGRLTESSMYNDGVMKAEQLRDIAIERNFACVSAVQFNRSGYHNVEAGIESVEGSSGYAETADLMISIAANDVLRSMGMFCHYILKSRLGQALVMFLTRCDFRKMRWFSPTADEVNAYNTAMAEVEPQINSPQRGQKQGPKRAISKQENASIPGGVSKLGVEVSNTAETTLHDTVSDYI